MDDRDQYDYYCTYCLSGYDHPDQFYASSLRKYVCRNCAKELGLCSSVVPPIRLLSEGQRYSTNEGENDVSTKSPRASRKRRNAIKY